MALDALRSIVTAQLEVEAPHKPARTLHPAAPASAEGQAAGRARALLRARARAKATYDRMIAVVASGGELDRQRAERAALLATCMLCRRLTPDEAQDLIAQLPSKLQPHLEQCLDGADRAVTGKAIEDEIGGRWGWRLNKQARHCVRSSRSLARPSRPVRSRMCGANCRRR